MNFWSTTFFMRIMMQEYLNMFGIKLPDMQDKPMGGTDE